MGLIPGHTRIQVKMALERSLKIAFQLLLNRMAEIDGIDSRLLRRITDPELIPRLQRKNGPQRGYDLCCAFNGPFPGNETVIDLERIAFLVQDEDPGDALR